MRQKSGLNVLQSPIKDTGISWFNLFWWIGYEEPRVHVNRRKTIKKYGKASVSTRMRNHIVSIIHFLLLPQPQKVNRENKATEIQTLEASCIFVFLLPHLTIIHQQHSSHWWLCYNFLEASNSNVKNENDISMFRSSHFKWPYCFETSFAFGKFLLHKKFFHILLYSGSYHVTSGISKE